MFLRLLLLSLILIIIGQTPLITPIRAAAAKISNPLQYGVYRFSQNLRGEIDFISNLRHLRAENLKLIDEVSELRAILTDYKEVKRENEKLKEQLGSLPAGRQVGEDQAGEKLILAQIVGRSARGGEATVTINKGSSSGVSEGAAVVFKNFLLGEAFAVEPERAKIRLLTDSRFSAAALDQDSPDRARGLVSGQYGTTVVLQKVLPTESLVVGDAIITSGEDEKFSPGLILGMIKKVLGQEAEVFKGAELDLMVDFDSLEEVFVVSRPF